VRPPASAAKGPPVGSALSCRGAAGISEALHRPGAVAQLIVADISVDRHRDLIRTASNCGVDTVLAPERAVVELAHTVTSQGLVAVCEMVDVATDEALGGALGSWSSVIRYAIQATSAR
jgi:TrmH family RNA methyltransferase